MVGESPALPPSLVLALIERLPEGSLYVAEVRGGRDHFGWTTDRYMLASLYDALNLNTAASGNWKKEPPDFKPWPRPGDEERAKKKKKKVSLESLFATLGGGRH